MSRAPLPSYPCWQYGAVGAVMFLSDEQWQAAEGEWHDSPADVPAQAESTDRQATIDLAAAKGMKIDRRWGAKRIADELAKAETAETAKE